MKLTKATLNQLIKEEMQKVLQEFQVDRQIDQPDWMADLRATADMDAIEDERAAAKRAKRAEREKIQKRGRPL